MGSPLSGTLANIYLNNFEIQHVMSDKNKFLNSIVYWHRYVDDIIVLFKGTKRQLEGLQQYINSIAQNLKFTLELEEEKSINYLDMKIKNNNSKHEFAVYRKPTQTEQTIHHTSDHPTQHKLSAYHHMLNRLNIVPLNEADYKEELETIIQIALNNGYTKNLIYKMNGKICRKMEKQLKTTLYAHYKENKKFISMEFYNNTNHIMKKVFKKFGYTICNKSSRKLVNKLIENHVEELDTGVYQINCDNCPMFYIGQTGRSFDKRFKEHIRELHKTPNGQIYKSNFAQHLAFTNHNYTDIDNNLSVLYKVKKSDMMNRLEEFEIYKHRNNNNLLNDKISKKSNILFDLII